MVFWKDGNYEISNDPVMPDCKSLYYTHHGRVSCVSKIGSNEKYIIVQSNEPNRKYWFINKAKDDYLLNDFEIVEGPYDLQTFNKLKIKKGIANLNFEEEF